MEKLDQAVKTFIARQDRTAHPAGRTDNGGRWYPAENEKCTCCNMVRSPSREWPWSLMVHCRTTEHIANLYEVDVKELRSAIRTAKKQLQPA